MEFIGNQEVQQWMSSLGIAFDGRQGPAIHPGELCTTWPTPKHQESWPYLASSLLMGLDPWEQIVVWPRAGHWLLPPKNMGGGVIIRGGPVPEGWGGGLRFSRGELHAVVAVMFVHLSIGWNADHDLFLVPDHGQQYLEVNHDDAIYVNFRSEARAGAFGQHMTMMGFLSYLEELDREKRAEQIVTPCGGIVQKGVIRSLEPDMLLAEQARVIIIGI